MRHAIVTGSSGGIGSAVCRLFLSRNWHVTGLDLVEPTSDSGWDHISVDLSLPGEAAAATRSARDARGAVTAVVHCAAVQTMGAAGTVTSDSWHRTLQVNVVSLDEVVAAVRADLAQNRGAVVAVSSVHASATTPSMAAYATAKAALEGWVRAAALDLAPEVRVNAVQPGAVRTLMLEARWARRPDEGQSEAALRSLAGRTPLRTIASPIDVGELVLLLIENPGTEFMTGCVVRTDGGALAQLSTE